MTSFAAQTTIKATPEAIWHILTDAQSYPSWHSTVTEINGRIALGEQVTVHVTASPGRAFPAKVVTFEAPKHMVWTSGMPLGLFKGERTYVLHPTAVGVVEFSMREDYSGLMAPHITRSIPDLQPAFDEFAACLKARAERH